MSAPLTEDDLVLAGELALGLLDGETLKAALERREADPAFAAGVADWEARLTPFVAETAPVEPPERVWTRIEAATFSPVAAPAAANDDGRVRFWRRWAFGASGLAAASLGALIVLASRPEPVAPAPPEPQPVRVASVAANGGVAVTVGVDPNDGALLVKAGEGLRAEGRVPYLWLMFPDGTVQWVAVVPVDRDGRLVLPPDVAARVGQAEAVAVSLEPQGVVPERNKPGGPVIGAGDLSDV
jgi:anti-sigma-K factor RskA